MNGFEFTLILRSDCRFRHPSDYPVLQIVGDDK